MAGSRQRASGAIASSAAMLAAAAATLMAYWPGLMTWDAVRQYGQAIDGDYDDWHPPAMEWLWRQLIPIHAGPAPMLVLQVALYWIGLGLLSAWAWRRPRPGLGVALASVGLLPLGMALMGAVLKDCLMAGALLAATGLLAWTREARRAGVRPLLAGLALALLLAAATLRFNAFLACMPLAVALLPARWRDRPWKVAAAAIVATALLMAPLPLANRLLHAERSGVELSLVIFDLGGITEESGTNVFPALGVANPIAVNHRCYSAVKWDPYSNWVDPPCPLGFEPFRAWAARTHASPTRLWAGAILAHPLAYALHRLHHFNINTRFLVHDPVERAVQVQSAPNDWHYTVHPGPLLSAIDAAATASAGTPLGWPIAGIALALGVLIAAPRLASRPLIVPIALSSLFYGLGYGVFSVAAELRYHLWTMLAALIAAAIAGADLYAMPVRPWRRIGWAAAPLVLVVVAASAFRLS
ncbi:MULTISPECIES: hypothetical protein [unclassified Sphingomonas]|uniref:hypothetical protein n=1 Tax=unclassified Sphingomonas TaxID=196159 RepID=UPI00226A4786|nr:MULTISPECIES: hypothetical protein [unclassified Sphingomonas]